MIFDPRFSLSVLESDICQQDFNTLKPLNLVFDLLYFLFPSLMPDVSLENSTLARPTVEGFIRSLQGTSIGNSNARENSKEQSSVLMSTADDNKPSPSLMASGEPNPEIPSAPTMLTSEGVRQPGTGTIHSNEPPEEPGDVTSSTVLFN